MFPQEVKQKLLQDLHVSHASTAVQEKLLLAVEKLFEEIFMSVSIENLSEDKKTIFLDILEKDSSGEKIMQYIHEQIPDFEKILGERLQEEIKNISV